MMYINIILFRVNIIICLALHEPHPSDAALMIASIIYIIIFMTDITSVVSDAFLGALNLQRGPLNIWIIYTRGATRDDYDVFR